MIYHAQSGLLTATVRRPHVLPLGCARLQVGLEAPVTLIQFNTRSSSTLKHVFPHDGLCPRGNRSSNPNLDLYLLHSGRLDSLSNCDSPRKGRLFARSATAPFQDRARCVITLIRTASWGSMPSL